MEETPSKREIEAQLQRILASPLFVGAKKQADLLWYVVQNGLAGNPISEKDIGPAVFPPFDPESNPVRAQASYLRTRLAEYYATTGNEDLVVIQVPPGAAYKPVFSYHSQSETISLHRRGISLSRQLDSDSLFWASAWFRQAQASNPAYAPACASLGEHELTRLVLHHLFDVTESVNICNYDYEKGAERALELDPLMCVPHIVVCIKAVFRRNWHEAQESIKRALEADAVMARGHLWYAVYLMITGEQAEALRISRTSARERPELITHFIHCFFLYLARRYEEADKSLQEVIAYDEAGRIQSLLSCLNSIAMEKYDWALRTLERASVIPDTEWERLEKFHDFTERPERFIGLTILCLGKMGMSEKASAKFEAMRRQAYVKPLQRAFAYLGMGDNERAMTALRRACYQGDLIGPWLPLLPLLDPFRGNPRFERLIELGHARPPKQVSS